MCDVLCGPRKIAKKNIPVYKVIALEPSCKNDGCLNAFHNTIIKGEDFYLPCTFDHSLPTNHGYSCFLYESEAIENWHNWNSIFFKVIPRKVIKKYIPKGAWYQRTKVNNEGAFAFGAKLYRVERLIDPPTKKKIVTSSGKHLTGD